MMRFASLLFITLAIIMSGVSQSYAQEIKKIAFSFDDTPRHQGAFLSQTERREILIKGLQNGGVKQAVFFLNPARIDGGEFKDIHMNIIAAYAAAGHVFANHTADHIRLSDVSAEEFLAEVDIAENWLKQRPNYRPWMRHPYLDEGKRDKVKREKVRAGLKQRSLINGYVTVDSSDWLIDSLAGDAEKAGKLIDIPELGKLFVESHVQSANFAHDLALRTLDRAPIQMMLLHEADVTAIFIESLAEALRADGWEIVSADEAFADPLAKMQSDADYVGGTILEVLAADKGISPRWYERNAPTVMTELFNQRVLHEETEK